jgi:pimeloyl-ACP methyl ester carboxylesterase
MTTYVLIPGFWLGGWAWRSVTEALEAHGHDVHALDLTGMGERAHLATPQTDLETHIDDVLDVIRERDLRDVVLVGHSYAGAVVTPAVADRMPERIATLVFVDTGPLPDGMTQAAFADPQEQADNAELVEQHGQGWKLPPPPWAQLAADVPDVDAAAITELETRSEPQPWLTATTPVRLTDAWEHLPRVGILSSFTEEQIRGMAAAVPMFALMDGEQWRYQELATWHWPMFSRPKELAELLHSAG